MRSGLYKSSSAAAATKWSRRGSALASQSHSFSFSNAMTVVASRILGDHLIYLGQWQPNDLDFLVVIPVAAGG